MAGLRCEGGGSLRSRGVACATSATAPVPSCFAQPAMAGDPRSTVRPPWILTPPANASEDDPRAPPATAGTGETRDRGSPGSAPFRRGSPPGSARHGGTTPRDVPALTPTRRAGSTFSPNRPWVADLRHPPGGPTSGAAETASRRMASPSPPLRGLPRRVEGATDPRRRRRADRRRYPRALAAGARSPAPRWAAHDARSARLGRRSRASPAWACLTRPALAGMARPTPAPATQAWPLPVPRALQRDRDGTRAPVGTRRPRVAQACRGACDFVHAPEPLASGLWSE